MNKFCYWKMEFGFVLLMGIVAASTCLAHKARHFHRHGMHFHRHGTHFHRHETRFEEISVSEILLNRDGERNPILATPGECARNCSNNELPKTCYYHFTLEMYTVRGEACKYCTPNATNRIVSECQCVLADGVERGILTANRMMPGPSIQVCEGDKVVIDVLNRIHGTEVTIHWHGVWQHGSQYYDGVPRLSQCTIQEGTTFRYQWAAANAGTHFWHAHTGFQKLDGLHGSLIIRQSPKNDLNSKYYDYDLSTHIVHINDWMHEDSSQRFPGLVTGGTGQTPENVLINGKGQFTDPDTGITTDTPLEVFTITSGRRYRFRLINAFATVCPAAIVFQGHTLTVIATDGEAVDPVRVNTIISYSGERYDFIIKADQPIGAYWIQLRGLGECGIDRIQNFAILRYEGGPSQPTVAAPTYDNGLSPGVVLNPLDGLCNELRNNAICISQLRSAIPVDKGILQNRPDVQIYLPFEFFVYQPQNFFTVDTYKSYLVAASGALVASHVGNISFEFPSAPPLSQINDISPEQFCNSTHMPPDCGNDCSCTHQYNIPLGSIVEIIFFDRVQVTNLSHPFHLHGQVFHVIGMGRTSDFKKSKPFILENAMRMDREGHYHRSFHRPPAKDTIAVPNTGYTIVRFRANNPGYWLLHCHFIVHLAIGMAVVLHVGTQNDLPPIPPNFPTCGNHLPPIRPPEYTLYNAPLSFIDDLVET